MITTNPCGLFYNNGNVAPARAKKTQKGSKELIPYSL